MKSHYCTAENTEIEFEGECNWCGKKEYEVNTYNSDQRGSITFFIDGGATEIMWINKNGVSVNPDFEPDEITRNVIHALDVQIRYLVSSAIDAEREAIAKMFDGKVWSYDYREIAAAIRARSEK